jgi:hypothetical protein
MAVDSLNRRQVFDSMQALVLFAGAGPFWDYLDLEMKAECADICRTQPHLKMFMYQKWVESEQIQAALAEFLEEEAASEPVVVVNTEY